MLRIQEKSRAEDTGSRVICSWEVTDILRIDKLPGKELRREGGQGQEDPDKHPI